MACQTFKQDGVTFIVCGPRARKRRCHVPGCAKPATLLCDWKVGKGTCDKAICADHALHVAMDRDLCPDHQERYLEWQARRAGNQVADGA